MLEMRGLSVRAAASLSQPSLWVRMSITLRHGFSPYMKVHEASPSLDAMLYPLIHLHAEDPWVEVTGATESAKRRRGDDFVSEACGTLRQYYSARLMSPDATGILFRCRGLFQQWLVDAALKIMDHNLRYAEEHQEELEVCHYDSLKRFVEDQARQIGKQPGRIVMIPRNEQKSERPGKADVHQLHEFCDDCNGVRRTDTLHHLYG